MTGSAAASPPASATAASAAAASAADAGGSETPGALMAAGATAAAAPEAAAGPTEGTDVAFFIPRRSSSAFSPRSRRRAASPSSVVPKALGSCVPPRALRHAAWCCALPAASPRPVRRVQPAARRSTVGCNGCGKNVATRNSSERSPLQSRTGQVGVGAAR